MGIGMRDAIGLPVLKKAKMLTPDELLAKRRVEWVSVIETPVENFVKQNEFVLSTGIGCDQDPQKLTEYVSDVIDSGASAIGFAMGRYIFQVPNAIIDVCEENEVVLLEIPWEVRFGDIMEAILQEISETGQDKQKRMEQVRQNLINCVLDGEGLSEILAIVYENTSIPVAVSDTMKTTRANQHFPEEMIDILNGKTAGFHHAVHMERSSYLEHHYPIEKYEFSGGECFQLTILSNHKKQGYLLFQNDTGRPFSQMELSILEHAVTACAIYFVKENAIEMTEIRLKDQFLLDLAKSKKTIDQSLLGRGDLLGYDLRRPYVCLVGEISFHKQADDVIPSSTGQIEALSMHSRNYYVQTEVQHAADQINRQRMITFDGDRVIIFLEAAHDSFQETTHQFLDLVERRLQELLEGITISWGVSLNGDGMQVFYESCQEAEMALTIGQKQGEPGTRTFFADTKMNRLLMALSKEEEAEEIVSSTIRDLINYDEKREAHLLHTFMMYKKHHNNVSQTARAMNLHRQSLLHRLRNIERLSGLSVLEADDSFLLELSIRLWTLKNGKTP